MIHPLSTGNHTPITSPLPPLLPSLLKTFPPPRLRTPAGKPHLPGPRHPAGHPISTTTTATTATPQPPPPRCSPWLPSLLKTFPPAPPRPCGRTSPPRTPPPRRDPRLSQPRQQRQGRPNRLLPFAPRRSRRCKKPSPSAPPRPCGRNSPPLTAPPRGPPDLRNPAKNLPESPHPHRCNPCNLWTFKAYDTRPGCPLHPPLFPCRRPNETHPESRRGEIPTTSVLPRVGERCFGHRQRCPMCG